MNWMVLHVKPRREKKMGEYCAWLGLEYYLPMRHMPRVYQRRKIDVEKPLFPGYVFVDCPEPQRNEVLMSNFVANVLDVVDQRKLLHELDQIRKALAVDPALGATNAFTRGKLVRVTRGPFQGLEGIIQVVKAGARVVLNVELIGRAVALEVDLDALESAE
jgi:transcription antitermination factor NusG